MLLGLFNELSSNGYLIRILECTSKRDLVRRLVSLHRRYNCAEALNLIQFLILSGHGSPDSISLGQRDSDDLKQTDVKRSGVHAIAQMFNKQAPIILQACSTGAWDGIGEALSNNSGLPVCAPSKPTTLKTIKVVGVNPLRFDVRFEECNSFRQIGHRS